MKKKFKIILIVFILLAGLILSSIIFLPDPLFTVTYSTVIYDRNNKLLGSHVASDEQWRFPMSSLISPKFKTAILLSEDKYFYQHPGFNPVSFYHAFIDNIKAGKIVRGGSTITMQTIRLSRKGKPRTIQEKLIELYLGIGLELKYSKEEILAYYSAHAPFGGNVVGLEAASWKYFGRDPSALSWAEAATLAVLPNSPALIHPGRNRTKLLKKRNALLQKIFNEGLIDSLTLKISLLEPLPEKPVPMPQLAPHLLNRLMAREKGKKMTTTINAELQIKVVAIVEKHHAELEANEIHNAAVLILKPDTYEVLAYVGNTKNTDGKIHGNSVDLIRAKRSTGSILKPLLYAAMLETGLIMPNSLVPDIPSYYENYHPENFDLTFEGSVPASEALSRSRNVPAVYMLRDYGVAPFLRLMKNVGLSGFTKPADHYGLTLILGGGEASLWELSNMYAGMVRTLLNYDHFYQKYTGREYDQPIIDLEQVKEFSEPEKTSVVPLHAGSVWLTYQALKNVKRPESESGWEFFDSSGDIAWKTGTSYGFKDAWAIGSTADYVVGVWVGNADGEGRTGLTGTRVAAPIMFEVFNLLPSINQFYTPFDELKEFDVCVRSGFRASRYCPEVETVYSYEKGGASRQCKYHKLIFTDINEKYRLSQECASVAEMKQVSWFVLPPVQEWYYRKSHPSYETLPPYSEGCSQRSGNPVMEFIYPANQTRIFVPVGIKEEQQEIIFQISHRFPSQKVYWHLDNAYLGETTSSHQFAFVPEKGWHTLTVVDEAGESNSVSFEVVNE